MGSVMYQTGERNIKILSNTEKQQKHKYENKHETKIVFTGERKPQTNGDKLSLLANTDTKGDNLCL